MNFVFFKCFMDNIQTSVLSFPLLLSLSLSLKFFILFYEIACRPFSVPYSFPFQNTLDIEKHTLCRYTLNIVNLSPCPFLVEMGCHNLWSFSICPYGFLSKATSNIIISLYSFFLKISSTCF